MTAAPSWAATRLRGGVGLLGRSAELGGDRLRDGVGVLGRSS